MDKISTDGFCHALEVLRDGLQSVQLHLDELFASKRDRGRASRWDEAALDLAVCAECSDEPQTARTIVSAHARDQRCAHEGRQRWRCRESEDTYEFSED